MGIRTSIIKITIGTLFLLSLPLYAFGAVNVTSRPTSFDITWDEVEGAEFYDIYINDVFRHRAGKDERSCTIDSLWSNEEYLITFASRDGNNKDLAAEFITKSTIGWDGMYRWEAGPEQDINKGKMSEIVIEVHTRRHPTYGQYLEVWSHIPEGRMKIYPIIEFDDLEPGWLNFRGSTDAEVTYKVTSEKFNKSSILPKTWKINTFRLGWNEESMTVETKATMGIRVVTTQIFTFGYTEEGKRYMDFYVDAPGYIRPFLALCDDEWSRDGEFRLTEI